MRRLIAAIAVAWAAGCGSPSDGEDVTYRGTVESAVECLALRTEDGRRIGLLGPLARQLRPGDRAEVIGTYAEASICHMGAVTVERVRKLE